MGERRRLPYAVKGPMAVGHHDDREATRPEHAVDLEDRGDGIGEVLENVGTRPRRRSSRRRTPGDHRRRDRPRRRHRARGGRPPTRARSCPVRPRRTCRRRRRWRRRLRERGRGQRSDLQHGASEAGAEGGSLASRHSSMKADRPPARTTSLHKPRSQRTSASAVLEGCGGGDFGPIPLHAHPGRVAADAASPAPKDMRSIANSTTCAECPVCAPRHRPPTHANSPPPERDRRDRGRLAVTKLASSKRIATVDAVSGASRSSLARGADAA